MRPWLLLVLLVLLAGCGADTPGAAADTEAYAQETEQWRAKRLARLRAPDGWLSYTGSGRLKPGRYEIGTATDNDIVVSAGPQRLGVLTLDASGEAWLEAAGGSDAMVNGVAVRRVRMQPSVVGVQEPTLIRVGNASFHLVRTGTLYGWRFRDPDAGGSEQLRRLDHFPVDPAWRVVADWQPFAVPQEVTLLTSIGTPQRTWAPGVAVFRIDGRQFQLRPVHVPGEDDQQLFFAFTDRTSGRETYGGARYLYTAMPTAGKLVLDFNRAQNPPCALTPHVVCPIAPPMNRLDLAVTAGEKSYLAGR